MENKVFPFTKCGVALGSKNSYDWIHGALTVSFDFDSTPCPAFIDKVEQFKANNATIHGKDTGITIIRFGKTVTIHIDSTFTPKGIEPKAPEDCLTYGELGILAGKLHDADLLPEARFIDIKRAVKAQQDYVLYGGDPVPYLNVEEPVTSVGAGSVQPGGTVAGRGTLQSGRWRPQ